MSVIELAKELGITVEGTRFNLIKLANEGFVESTNEVKGRGRPQQVWTLTRAGHDQFPASYKEVSIGLIKKIQDIFGDQGMYAVLASAEEELLKKYSDYIKDGKNLEEQLQLLAEIRSQEGYMASVEANDIGYLFIENHCPICEAARVCQNFCSVELQVFQSLFKEEVRRTEHLMNKGRRCVYQIYK
ncbi:helix-turn-helix transcriptional regulator [Sphingobacterium sp. HJSM2_6]